MVIIVAGGGYVYQKIRGIRNNNPGNIRRTSDKWRGLAPLQTDPEYFVFDAPVWGIRAMAKLLLNYQRNYGLTTIREIISRWAPDNENDTESYIRSVSLSMGIADDQPLMLGASKAEHAALVKAIIKHENGINPYSDDLIFEAIDLI
jgi:hypothetical protein